MLNFPLSHEHFNDDPGYHEELAILRAQERIQELMRKSGTTKAELARKLGKSKSFVTRLFSDGHNMTIKTYANVLFQLGEEALFESLSIRKVTEQQAQLSPSPS